MKRSLGCRRLGDGGPSEWVRHPRERNEACAQILDRLVSDEGVEDSAARDDEVGHIEALEKRAGELVKALFERREVGHRPSAEWRQPAREPAPCAIRTRDLMRTGD